MFVLTSDNSIVTYPYSPAKLRRDNPSTSFPDPLTDEDLASWGVFRVEAVAAPAYDFKTEDLVEGTPVYEGGVWRQAWTVETASQEEIDKRAEAAARDVRSSRNQELAATDWTQLLDSQVDSATWAVYRQQLRDIPQQDGFPWDVTWPDGYEA